MTPNATVIYPSRKKLLLLTAGGGVFVALGFFLLQSTDIEERLAGIASIVFFGACALFGTLRLVRPTPAVILHSSGIFDNASALPAGFLHWDEISSVYVATIKNQRSLAIALKDVNAFLSRQSGMKSKLMKMNVNLVGAAVNIPASTLPISLEELIQQIQQKCPAIHVVTK